MPPTTQLEQFKGKKDGDIKLFKNNNIPVIYIYLILKEAYCWKASENRWEKIGEVINPSA